MLSVANLFYILDGVWTTLAYTVIAVFIGFLMGVPLALVRSSHNTILSLTSRLYISVIRGTPVLLQLSFWYFAFPRLTGVKISPFVAGSLAFAINSSAYIAEIVRSGIIGVDKGQTEAAQVLGISKRDIFLNIIIPQAMRNIYPALMNEMISMLKETAVIGAIGILDLTRRAQLIGSQTYDFFSPLIVAAACYYFLGLMITSIYYFISRTSRKY